MDTPFESIQHNSETPINFVLVNDEDSSEVWHEVFKDQIPKDDYAIKIRMGELCNDDIGVVYLQGSQYDVSIDFQDNVQVRVLGREMLQTENFAHDQVIKYQVHNFANIIYKVENSRLLINASSSSFEWFKLDDLRHFIIVGKDKVVDFIMYYGSEECISIKITTRGEENV